METAELKRESINARLEEGFLDATTLMEYLIKQGVPMRTGHETVGTLVALCEKKDCRLADLSLEEFQQACDLVQENVFDSLGVQNAVNAFVTEGSGAPEQVKTQLAFWKEKLSE